MMRSKLFAATLIVVALPLLADESSRDGLPALEKQLHGEWDGVGPCDGTLILKADRTFEWNLCGPAGNNSTGTWALRWDALPPTLTLNYKESDAEGVAGQSRAWKVLRLDSTHLSIREKGAKKRLKFRPPRDKIPAR